MAKVVEEGEEGQVRECFCCRCCHGKVILLFLRAPKRIVATRVIRILRFRDGSLYYAYVSTYIHTCTVMSQEKKTLLWTHLLCLETFALVLSLL